MKAAGPFAVTDVAGAGVAGAGVGIGGDGTAGASVPGGDGRVYGAGEATGAGAHAPEMNNNPTKNEAITFIVRICRVPLQVF